MIDNNGVPPSSRLALRRLLIVLAIVAGIVIYAYGWQVTDINIEETQEPVRQASVQRALQELLSPDLFDQENQTVVVQTDFLMNCADNPPASAQPSDQPYIVVSPTCGSRGDPITLEGFNFEPNAATVLRWVPPNGQKRPLDPIGSETNVIDTDATGHFQVTVEVPSIRGGEDTVHQIETEARISAGTPELSQTAHDVLEKMVETVFLALMATTIAVPISVVVSFLAAHNLMPQVRIPLGSALVGFILVPVGFIVGALLLSPVGDLGIRWGKELWMGIVSPVVAIAAYGFGARAVNQLKIKNGIASRIRAISMSILLLVVVIYTLGAVGGLGIWAGDQLEGAGASMQSVAPGLSAIVGTLVGALGNFFGTLGRIVEFGMAVIAGLAGAFLFATNGMELSVIPLKSLSGVASQAVGGVLGLFAGAFLLLLSALIGLQGALLTLFAPLVAALLAGQIPAMLYDRWRGAHRRTGTDQSIRTVLALAAGIAAFAWTYLALGLGRNIVDGRLPAEIPWQTINLLGTDMTITQYFRDSAVIGALLGGVAGLLAGVHVSFPVGSIIYNVTRTILNTLRSIEPLIMGLVFVIWVGIGPFAGVLALTLHSIASLGKLYSEQIESIDPGPIEAILATGANRLQMIVYAVVPQIVPPYIAFTMYRWDINVRMSTIIGFVGGGGIGFLLYQQIQNFRYHEAGVAVLAIAIVVSVLDYASAYIRERMV